MNLISRGKCLLTRPVACFSGGVGGERRSARTSGGEEGEGAESPPEPAGGPHQQWDPVRVSPAGGGHRVSVSTNGRRGYSRGGPRMGAGPENACRSIPTDQVKELDSCSTP